MILSNKFICWSLSGVPTVLPPALGIGIVIGTVVTLIMAITVIVLVMIVLKCRRHSKLQGNTIIYNNDI